MARATVGISKIIMTHTNRYMKDAELRELERSGEQQPASALPDTGAAAQVDGAVQGTAHGASSGADARFDRVRRQMMSFDDFLEATRSTNGGACARACPRSRRISARTCSGATRWRTTASCRTSGRG